MLIVQSFNKTALVSTDDTPRGPEGDGADELGGGMPATTEMDSAMDELLQFLEMAASAQADDAIIVSEGDGFIYVSFNSSVFFDGDRYELRPEGKEILDGILPALDAAAPYIDQLVVSGHTASALGRYDADWDYELSCMRAARVTSYLLKNSAELDPGRTQAMGYGQWRPVSGNDAESDRSKNRRVEMMISGKNVEEQIGDSIASYYTETQQTQPGSEQPATPAEGAPSR